MRQLTVIAFAFAIAACHGEKPPRDYQNSPPAMMHPVTSSSGTPTAHGMPGAAPEPTSGAEGNNITLKPTSPVPPTYTMKDQPPVTTDSQHATQTTSTAATGTHLAPPP